MKDLNYHHLLYFWEVARQKSVSRAAKQMSVSQPTVSAQIKALEKALGDDIFIRTGRDLVLTELGQLVFEYANEIFTIGRELGEAVSTRRSHRPIRLRIGVTDSMPKTLAELLIRPAVDLGQRFRMTVHSGPNEKLVEELAAHELDVLLTNDPSPVSPLVKGSNFPLGESGVTFMATPDMAKKISASGDFPKSLEAMPMLLPGMNTSLRRSLDDWFAQNGIRPDVIGEFTDSTMLKTFGQRGLGVFPILTAVERMVTHQFRVRAIGRTDDVRERVFAVASSKRLTHPGVEAICRQPKIIATLIEGIPASEIGTLKRIAKRLRNKS